ncbi:DUF3349 domain-containing protein [Streptacidiphilus carbonis]|uniref:DUF3349 domain-containing protein n=1 Tax=Streptacidiphilus carbonis TaxID=105422 RepID=UPI0005AAACE3|nr:DUF3349 domain-containing protein [Streptacidiphilus carbonis]
MPLPPVLSSIVGWLRAGYPEGVPERDYVPLFALLASQLTDDQVFSIVDELVGGSDPITARTIREAAEATANGPLADADVARVRARLAAGGWPLARPEG